MPGESVFMAPEECGMNSDDQDGILLSCVRFYDTLGSTVML